MSKELREKAARGEFTPGLAEHYSGTTVAKLTNKQILQKAIEKALINGWEYPEMVNVNVLGHGEELAEKLIEKDGGYGIIFSHDFAKAFWGERECGCNYIHDELGCCNNECRNHGPCSQLDCDETYLYHLQQLAIAEDRLEYIGRFL